MSRVILENKTPGETAKEIFDFSSKLAVGETLTSAAVAISIYSGTDNTMQLSNVGVATISGAQISQVVAGGVEGVIYKLVATVHTSTDQMLTMTGYLPVVPA